MLENDFIYWIIGAILGAIIASFMATHEHRWLRRPVVLLLSAVLGASVAALAAETSMTSGWPAIGRSAAAAWFYPWAWLTILTIWRRTLVSSRIFHLPATAALSGPLCSSLVAICMLFYKPSVIHWVATILIASIIGVALGQIFVQIVMHYSPHTADPSALKSFRRALLYPTIDGSPLLSTPPRQPKPLINIKTAEDKKAISDLLAQDRD